MPDFIVTETSSYRVTADSEADAIQRFNDMESDEQDQCWISTDKQEAVAV